MKRLALLLVFCATTLVAAPADKWWDAYDRGVKAVNAKSYSAAAEALQKSINEMPSESTAARTKNEIITYVPHFWLGIAKFNLGDVDGALREWKTSEDQGAIGKTEYYSKLKDWVARAQVEKQRTAESAASGAKKLADAALSRALAAQVAALSAGGDRSETYRNAQRRLQDALSLFHKAGTDISAYGRAEETAKQASELFAGAAEEGKKLKAAQKALPPKQQAKPIPQTVAAAAITPPPQMQTPVTTTVGAAGASPAVVPPKNPAAEAAAAPPPPVESAARVDARIAVQDYRRAVVDAADSNKPNTPLHRIAREEMRETERLRVQLDHAKDDGAFNAVNRAATQRREAFATKLAQAKSNALAVAPEVASAEIEATPKRDLEAAYRAFALGDLAGSEARLDNLLAASPSKEAYVLRGCARYTRALLARDGEQLAAAARVDFESALALDRSLRLDKRAFSPKLVAFFEQVRARK
ncbi:MAG TPA: hypothetical protein VFN10_22525 [Thermoanaerobaculia bacterium]|nr:hypothetical protein [Thermoanaerobaculia bacterium]